MEKTIPKSRNLRALDSMVINKNQTKRANSNNKPSKSKTPIKSKPSTNDNPSNNNPHT